MILQVTVTRPATYTSLLPVNAAGSTTATYVRGGYVVPAGRYARTQKFHGRPTVKSFVSREMTVDKATTSILDIDRIAK